MRPKLLRPRTHQNQTSYPSRFSASELKHTRNQTHFKSTMLLYSTRPKPELKRLLTLVKSKQMSFGLGSLAAGDLMVRKLFGGPSGSEGPTDKLVPDCTGLSKLINSELNSVLNWQPTQLTEHWFYMSSDRCPRQNTCSCILNHF